MGERIEDMIKGHRDAITVAKVFGEPYEKNGVTVVPAAKVMGGGGGGAGTSPEDGTEGTGTGFGLVGKAMGVYVIKGDDVRWVPAVDVNRIVAGVLALAALAIVVGRRR